MKTCVFIAIVVVGLSGGRFSDEKGCCLSSKTREKNVCRGRMIELSTEMARVAEVDRGILWDEEGNWPEVLKLITRVFTRMPSRLTAVKPLPMSNTGSPRFTDFPSLCACSESSLTNLIGSGLNLLCLQSHSKPECRWTRSRFLVLTKRSAASGKNVARFEREKNRTNLLYHQPLEWAQ